MSAKINNIYRSYKSLDILPAILEDVYDLILERAKKDIEHNGKVFYYKNKL